MIALIADIHGNYPALDAVLVEIKKIGVRRIYSLGDTAGYYSMINECIDLLVRNDVASVMGNHDNYLVNNVICERSRMVNNCINYQREIISAKNLEWLGGASTNIVLGDMNMLHGGWSDPLEEYLNMPDESYFANRNGRCFFSAHTHVQCELYFNDGIYCNPGSVGQPRDGDPRAGFAIVDENSVFLQRVRYDIDRIAEHMKKCGFQDYYYNNLYIGKSIHESA